MLKFMRYLLLVIIITLTSCYRYEEKIHVDAEITDVQYYSDTSVLISIAVHGNSNAVYYCLFRLYYDTVPLVDYFRSPFHEISNECDLKSSMDTVIAGFKENSNYYIQLFSGGSFDIGITDESARLIGNQVRFNISELKEEINNQQ